MKVEKSNNNREINFLRLENNKLSRECLSLKQELTFCIQRFENYEKINSELSKKLNEADFVVVKGTVSK